MLKPILTEKSLADVKAGRYSFYVSRGTTKHQVKLLVNKEYGVDVVKVFTMNVAGESRRSYTGRRRVIKPQKKAIVTLKKDQKIDAFDIKE